MPWLTTSWQPDSVNSMGFSAEVQIGIVLSGSPERVQRWCQSEGLVTSGGATAFAGLLTVRAANGLILAVDPLVHRLTELACISLQANPADVAPVFHLQIASVIASPWFGASSSFTTDVVIGLTASCRAWVSEVNAASSTERTLRAEPLEPATQPGWRPPKSSAVMYVAAAALDRYASERGHSDYRYKLERIQSILGLRPTEMARLLDVSREGLRKWELGAPIADERLADLDDLYDFSIGLMSHIRPEAIGAFIHRRIPALANQRPLDWLVSRRLQELRAVYEKAFQYEAV
jgi:hypothetical protein